MMYDTIQEIKKNKSILNMDMQQSKQNLTKL